MKALFAALVALALALAVPLAAAAPVDGGVQTLQVPGSAPPPWFCHNLDCPRYEVMDVTDAYEVRRYEAGSWVSTDVEAYAYALATNKGFSRLFQYIQGANKEAATIPMTSPVRTKVSAAAGPFCKNNFTVSFFVPFAWQKKGAPKPNNPEVYLEDSPSFTAYVAQKGGFVVDDWSVQKMVKNLAEAVEADDKEYDSDTFYVAGYDPPFRLAGRHNEVWLVAKEDEAAHTAE